MVDNSLARVIALKASTKFNQPYRDLESLAIDGRNKILIKACVLLLIAIGFFTFRDYGVAYTSSLPVIAYLSITLSQSFFHESTFSKSRIDELLEYLLLKERAFVTAADPRLPNVQLLCNFIIDEYNYESGSAVATKSDSTPPTDEPVGFDKAKAHLANISSDLGSGLKILLVFLAIGLLAAALKSQIRDSNRAERTKASEVLQQMQKLADEKNK